jgi:pimeloyl-ACP methyl ester carboxylesterase
MTLLPLLCSSALLAGPQVETRLEQVAPIPPNGEFTRSEGQKRAVVLIHGFIYHSREASVPKAAFRDWQRPGATLVKTLRQEADVYSFAYSQNVPLDEVVRHPGLGDGVEALKKLGYKEIVLVAHSAGGLVARQFVEDNPSCAVTKVIQVCVPNAGTPTAKTKVLAAQQAFLDCLTPEARQKCLEARADRRIPERLEFVCVLGHLDASHDTDGVVPCACQWSPDLRRQGISAVPLEVSHRESTRSAKSAQTLARLVREKQARWPADQVEQLAEQLFKK